MFYFKNPPFKADEFFPKRVLRLKNTGRIYDEPWKDTYNDLGHILILFSMF